MSNRQRNAHGTTQEWVIIRGTKCVKNQTKLSFDFLLYRDQYNGLTLRFQSLLWSFLAPPFTRSYERWIQSLRFQSLRFQSHLQCFLLHFSQKWIINTINGLPYCEHYLRIETINKTGGPAHAVRASIYCILVCRPYCMRIILSVSTRFVTHFWTLYTRCSHHIWCAIWRTHKAKFTP